MMAKSKRFRDALLIWMSEYNLAKFEKEIRRKRETKTQRLILNEWKTIWTQIVTQRNRFQSVMARTDERIRINFLVLWYMQYRSRQIGRKCTRTGLRMRIGFWRQCTRNRIQSRTDLKRLQRGMDDKWSFYPSVICQHDPYFRDDDEEEAQNAEILDGESNLHSLKSISTQLAPILAQREKLHELKPYKRPTTPTLLCAAKKKQKRCRNLNHFSKDDLFVAKHSGKVTISFKPRRP
eukprot:CAMPEP_0197039860 /NCGR_PEP_ID=MMETSP1384-20130603/16627_1 /TAXON_ID=29189 /ORGANISM="Ammonia sp." /LENGTH=235 /DNA_ID=CAMNT_0042470523 /DNA_START=51 /DNA_END=754 /DNA_ORIENTATION=-